MSTGIWAKKTRQNPLFSGPAKKDSSHWELLMKLRYSDIITDNHDTFLLDHDVMK